MEVSFKTVPEYSNMTVPKYCIENRPYVQIDKNMVWEIDITNPDFAAMKVPYHLCHKSNGLALFPEKVIFNGPATIVYWSDGDKTIVKCMKGDTYSKEAGFAIACAKKMFGGGNKFRKLVKRYVPKDEEETCD